MSNYSATYRLLDDQGALWAECYDADVARELAARQGLEVLEILTYDGELIESYCQSDEATVAPPCYEVEGEGCVTRYCTVHGRRKDDPVDLDAARDYVLRSLASGDTPAPIWRAEGGTIKLRYANTSFVITVREA